MSAKAYLPVVIIGAGRSGTNMLRDVLVRLPGFGTWPCEEINYIWRHGNARWPTDELSPEQATPRVQAFIRHAFDKLAMRHGLSHVVEKTCANSVRVGFVNAILPEAKFIHIIRDGRDVVASACKRWTAPFDFAIILPKIPFIPISDLPYYAVRYAWNRVYRLASREKRLAFWGSRFEGMTEALHKYSLAEVCALQWIQCVEKASQDLSTLPASRVLRMHYEDFVAEPVQGLKNIVDFLGVEIASATLPDLVADIKTDSIGKSRKELEPARLTAVEHLMQETLARYGYA